MNIYYSIDSMTVSSNNLIIDGSIIQDNGTVTSENYAPVTLADTDVRWWIGLGLPTAFAKTIIPIDPI